ncbi:MAG TPA: metallophosphoesterase [Polyangiaceae bacterium]
MNEFLLGSLAAWACVVAIASRRSRSYMMFRAVSLGIYVLLASSMVRQLAPLAPAFYYLHAAVFVHSLALVAPRMRPLWYRALVSIPSAFMSAGTLLALPWAIAGAVGFEPWAPWAPYLAALLGLVQSFTTKTEEVDITVADGEVIDGVQRHRDRRERVARPLHLVQITDPHLGPFMSEARLRAICERAVRREPDLVLLTGDFLTMESQKDPAILARALAPLKALEGRVFACFGNHDHEAPETVRRALTSVGAELLVDAASVVQTAAGPVQIVGFDFSYRERARRMQACCEAHPRLPGTLRIALLHDPGAFQHLPAGEADLVVSGHTHGGQVGLVSLGLPWTMLRLFAKIPDHGLWARGTDRLYVHRGTGHYGFPLRLGVPAEESLLRVHAAPAG